MARKQCLFCDEIVPIENQGDYDQFVGCYCSPESSYLLQRSSYNSIQAYTHLQKRAVFPVISAYIREKTDCNEKIRLTESDLDSIMNAPDIPVTIEDKATRLLLYLFRHSEKPEEPVVIRPLSHSFNLTYSPNLQELVYIIDKLRGEEFLIREGGTFKLTGRGWIEAEARAGGRKLKSCYIVLPDNENLHAEWKEKVLPRLEQCGFLPKLWEEGAFTRSGEEPGNLLNESKLVIADITDSSPQVYLTGGIAWGRDVPVIWTARHIADNPTQIHPVHIRPLVYNNAEDLADKLQQKLTSS